MILLIFRLFFFQLVFLFVLSPLDLKISAAMLIWPGCNPNDRKRGHYFTLLFVPPNIKSYPGAAKHLPFVSLTILVLPSHNIDCSFLNMFRTNSFAGNLSQPQSTSALALFACIIATPLLTNSAHGLCNIQVGWSSSPSFVCSSPDTNRMPKWANGFEWLMSGDGSCSLRGVITKPSLSD